VRQDGVTGKPFGRSFPFPQFTVNIMPPFYHFIASLGGNESVQNGSSFFP
jgi:hypothetical protein